MYKLLLFSRTEVVLLDKIKAEDVIKAIALFNARNSDFRINLYEYSSFADNEDEYWEVFHLWR